MAFNWIPFLDKIQPVKAFLLTYLNTIYGIGLFSIDLIPYPSFKNFFQQKFGSTVPVKGIAALHARKAHVLHAHYTQLPRSVHAVPTQCPRSVHAPYTQIHEDACNYMHVVTRSGRDIACQNTHSRPTGTH